MRVSPKTWVTVTEPSSATAPGFLSAQAASADAATAVMARKLRRDQAEGTRRL
jgi:hypothetical protein